MSLRPQSVSCCIISYSNKFYNVLYNQSLWLTVQLSESTIKRNISITKVNKQLRSLVSVSIDPSSASRGTLVQYKLVTSMLLGSWWSGWCKSGLMCWFPVNLYSRGCTSKCCCSWTLLFVKKWHHNASKTYEIMWKPFSLNFANMNGWTERDIVC